MQIRAGRHIFDPAHIAHVVYTLTNGGPDIAAAHIDLAGGGKVELEYAEAEAFIRQYRQEVRS